MSYGFSVTSGMFKFTGYKFKLTSYGYHSTRYEFKSTNRKIKSTSQETTLFFLIRTSKFCLRLAVLNFFHFWGWNVLISPTEPCNATKKNVRLSTIKAHYFISFILFLSNSPHRQPLGGVLQKISFATVLKPIKKCLRRSFSLKLQASNLQLH